MSEALLLTVDDFANCGFEFVESLRSVGVDAYGFKSMPHGFNYLNQLPIPSEDGELFAAARSAPRILYLQSTRLVRDAIPKDCRFKKIFLFVGDQGYRNCPAKVLSYYPKIDKVFYQGSDLKGKSPFPEEWLLPAIDTDFITTQQDMSLMSHKGPITIAHFPRNPEDKGSAVINKVMAKLGEDPDLKDKFVYKYDKAWAVDWVDNLKRMDQCDVYIESQAYTIGKNNVPLCEFGVTAMECASLSKLVVSCFISYNDYIKEFNNIPALYPSNSEEELEANMRNIILMPEEKLLEERIKTRDWIVKYHGRIPTGLRLKKLMGIGV